MVANELRHKWTAIPQEYNVETEDRNTVWTNNVLCVQTYLELSDQTQTHLYSVDCRMCERLKVKWPKRDQLITDPRNSPIEKPEQKRLAIIWKAKPFCHFHASGLNLYEGKICTTGCTKVARLARVAQRFYKFHKGCWWCPTKLDKGCTGLHKGSTELHNVAQGCTEMYEGCKQLLTIRFFVVGTL